MRLIAPLLACCATVGAQASPIDQVSEAAAGALLAAMSSQGLTGVVQPRALVRSIDAVAANLRVQPRPIASDQMHQRMLVWVDLWAGDRFVRSVPVALEVSLSQGSAAVTPTRRDSQAAGAGAGADAARRHEAAADVLRGEWAALRTSAGAVSLESRVEVLQDGRSGDRIRVRQQGATGIVLARVVGRGQLELAP